MEAAVQDNHPVPDIVGAGYTAEHGANDPHVKRPVPECETQFGDFMKSLRMLVGGEPAITKR